MNSSDAAAFTNSSGATSFVNSSDTTYCGEYQRCNLLGNLFCGFQWRSRLCELQWRNLFCAFQWRVRCNFQGQPDCIFCFRYILTRFWNAVVPRLRGLTPAFRKVSSEEAAQSTSALLPVFSIRSLLNSGMVVGHSEHVGVLTNAFSEV